MSASITPNQQAVLDMLAWSEGTETVLGSDNGYNVLVGGNLFHSYADHPRILVRLSPKLSSTAAGRYQLLARYFDAYKAQLHLPDFSPASQDAIALQQIRERNALSDIEAGRIQSAIDKCSNIWASLPGRGNTYGQALRPITGLLMHYVQAGGYLAP